MTFPQYSKSIIKLKQTKPNHITHNPSFIIRFNPWKKTLLRLIQNNSIVCLLEPLHSFLPRNLVRVTNVAALSLSLAHTTSRTRQLHIEIHTENTCVRIILNTEIDMLLNTKAEVSRLREVSLHQLVFLHLQTALKDFKGLLASNRGMHRDLLITTN